MGLTVCSQGVCVDINHATALDSYLFVTAVFDLQCAEVSVCVCGCVCV